MDKSCCNAAEMRISSETLSDILKTMRDMAEAYRFAIAGQQEAEGLENDLRHDLELKDLTYRERALIATQMQQALRERRKNKDLVERLSPFAAWFDSNTSVVKTLERTLGEMRKVEEKHKNRRYVYRSKPDAGRG